VLSDNTAVIQSRIYESLFSAFFLLVS